MPESLPLVVVDFPLSANITQLLSERVRLAPWEDALAGHAQDATGVFTYMHPLVDDAFLERLPHLRVIANHGVGIDHIDLAAARRRGIPVSNTPKVLDESVAELAFVLLLAASRRLIECDAFARSEQFTHFDASLFHGRELSGSTLGILGLGGIGKEIARRALGFSMRVIYHNRRPRPAESFADLATAPTYVSFPELLSSSDYLVLCLPLTSETQGVIGADQLSQMKPTSILINVGRGALVDTAALTEALQQQRIGAAALDVTEPEPLPRDHPLLQLSNVVITPHIGSATIQARRRMAELSIENLMLGLAGQPLSCEVK